MSVKKSIKDGVILICGIKRNPNLPIKVNGVYTTVGEAHKITRDQMDEDYLKHVEEECKKSIDHKSRICDPSVPVNFS